MYEVSKDVWLCAAHQVRFPGGEAEPLHGHNWRVRVTVCARKLDPSGYVIDFDQLGRAMWAVVGRFDHANLNELAPFDELNPTAENLARHVYASLARALDDDRCQVHEVEVFETDANRAVYRAE